MSRIYRFFLRNNGKLEGDKFLLSAEAEPEIIFQLTKVLRVKSGDMITLVSGQLEHIFEVGNVLKNGVELLKKNTVQNMNELNFELDLWLCVPNKPEKLEFILQKAVELGVHEIALFESEFSQMKHVLRMDRLEKIITEAAEQSERGIVPALKLSGNLSQYLRNPDAEKIMDVRVAMERGGNLENPRTALQEDNLAILIGPEGGFSDDEKELFDLLMLRQFSLGKRVLRMETAAILSLGLASMRDS